MLSTTSLPPVPTSKASSAVATALSEDFEDGDVLYTTTTPEFSDGVTDFFTRTDGTNISDRYSVTGASGSFYFAAQDIDGEGADAVQSLVFSGIDISGLTALSFSALFAEDDDGGNQDWDEPDFVRVYVSIDGGAEVQIFGIENDGSTFNSAPFVDTDLNGTGDGAEVTSAFAPFSAAITGTGSTLDLRIEMSLDSGDEDIAIDDVAVTGMEEVVAAECAVGTGLSFLEGGPFDADGLPSGEVLSIFNLSPEPVSTGGCSLGIFDPFTEQVTYSFELFEGVIPGVSDVISGVAYGPFPNVIPDGPGAVVLVEGPVAVGASVSDVLGSLVSAMVYRSETDIYAIYSSYQATATDTADFLDALASLSNPVATESDPGIDLAVTAAPNPFRARTTLTFGVPEAADVRVGVYDALGREVARLVDAPYGAGRHEAVFETGTLPAGVYVVRATVGADTRTVRVTVAR